MRKFGPPLTAVLYKDPARKYSVQAGGKMLKQGHDKARECENTVSDRRIAGVIQGWAGKNAEDAFSDVETIPRALI